MTNNNQIKTYELGKYKGWDVKSLVNNKKGTVEYMAYFEKGPISGLTMLNADTLSGLKEKIEKSKLRKGAI